MESLSKMRWKRDKLSYYWSKRALFPRLDNCCIGRKQDW